LVPGGAAQATTHVPTIEGWWRRFPQATVGRVARAAGGVEPAELVPAPSTAPRRPGEGIAGEPEPCYWCDRPGTRDGYCARHVPPARGSRVAAGADERAGDGVDRSTWRPKHVGAWARVRVWRLTGLGRLRRSVLAALASYMDARGSCYPSLRRLAEIVEVSPRRVSQAVGELEALELIRVRRHPDRNSVYTLDVAAVQDFPQIERRPRRAKKAPR
jgi:hypothetical protein